MFQARLACVALVALVAAGAARAQSVHVSHGGEAVRAELRVGPGAPVPAYHAPAYRTVERRVWVPGHYEELERRVWVEGGERREWVPPVYETRFDECGRPVSVLLRQGYWNTVRQPGCFELRTVRVWVEGYWRTEPVACAPHPAPRQTYGERGRAGRFDGFRYDGRR